MWFLETPKQNGSFRLELMIMAHWNRTNFFFEDRNGDKIVCMIIDSKNKSFCSFRLSKKAKVNYHQYCVRNNFLSLFLFIKQATFVIGLPEEFFIEKAYPFIPTYRHTFLVRFRSSMAPERHIAVLSQNTHTLIVCICAQSRDSLHLFLSSVFSLSLLLARSLPVCSFSTSTFTIAIFFSHAQMRASFLFDLSREHVSTKHYDRSQRIFSSFSLPHSRPIGKRQENRNGLLVGKYQFIFSPSLCFFLAYTQDTCTVFSSFSSSSYP